MDKQQNFTIRLIYQDVYAGKRKSDGIAYFQIKFLEPSTSQSGKRYLREAIVWAQAESELRAISEKYVPGDFLEVEFQPSAYLDGKPKFVGIRGIVTPSPYWDNTAAQN